MPKNMTDKNHDENETMHMIPFIEHEYRIYKVSKLKNRIACALAVTNIAWFVLGLAFFIFRIYEKI